MLVSKTKKARLPNAVASSHTLLIAKIHAETCNTDGLIIATEQFSFGHKAIFLLGEYNVKYKNLHAATYMLT